VCGVCDRSLILNLPGSPSGAIESLAAVADVLGHAIDLIDGKTEHVQ
jgi:molybdopterin biosynthesis enzyme MoaB